MSQRANTPLSRTVAATYSASDISSYLVTVTATTGDKDGTTVASITATPGQTVTIDQLEEAKYSVVVTAFNAAKETIAGGQTSVETKAGSTSEAIVSMSFNILSKITALTIASAPAIKEYTLGSTLDLTGLVLTATFKSGFSCTLTDADYTTTPANGTIITADTQTVIAAVGNVNVAIPVTVVAWMPTIIPSSGDNTSNIFSSTGTTKLAAGQTYTLALSNTAANSDTVDAINKLTTWKSDSTAFSITSATLTAPAATLTAPVASSAAQQATITATTTYNGTEVKGSFIVSVDATSTTIAVSTFSELRTAIETTIKDGTGTITLSNDFDTGSETSTITVSGNVTIQSSGYYTISRAATFTSAPLFTVTGTLVLGSTTSTTNTITLDGGSSTKSITASAPLVSCTGNLTIGKNCTLEYNNNNSTDALGGAIYCDLSSADNTFALYGYIIGNTSAKNGGGIYIVGTYDSASNKSSAVTLSGCSISGNTAATNGGGAFLSKVSATCTDSTFTSNTASGTASTSGGGALYVSGTTAATSVLITGGSVIGTTDSSNTAATNGGALFINSGTVTLNDASICYNKAGSSSSCYGGGVYVASSSATFTLTKGSISNNTAYNTTENYGSQVYLASGGMYYFGTNAVVTGASSSGTQYNDAQTVE